MKKILCIVVLIILLTSCIERETVETSQRYTISFIPYVGKSTKASDITKSNLQNFFVYGGYEEANQVFNGDLVIKSDDNSWVSSESRYWVKGKTYSFAAIAPINIEASYDLNELLIHGFTPENEDIVVALSGPIESQSYNQAISLNFRHALSKVQISFMDFEFPDSDVQISDVSLNNVLTKGDLSVNYDNGTNISWKPESDKGSFTCSITDNNSVKYLLPQFITDEANISFHIKITLDDEIIEDNYSIKLMSQQVSQWEVGHAYNYVINLNSILNFNEITFFVEDIPSWGDEDVNLDSPTSIPEPDPSTFPTWELPGNIITEIEPEREKMLRNDLTGWVLYTGLGDGLSDSFWEDYDNMESAKGRVKMSDYSHVLFIRAAWSYFNPEEGKYAWDEDVNTKEAQRFKWLVKGAEERNMKLAFSFICDSRDKHDNFSPDYVKEAGAKGYVTTTGSVQVWSPYPDDPVFQEKYETFLHAFAQKYDDPDVTMFISGTGLGKWGESHSVIYSTDNVSVREKTFNWITDLFMKEFKKVPCILNYHRAILSTREWVDNPSELTYNMLRSAVNKGFSLRHDAFGMKQYYKDWERDFATGHKFQRPILMEGGWVKSSHGSSINSDGYANYAEVRQGEYNEGKNACVNMMDFRYNSDIKNGETWSWMNEAYDLVEDFIQEGGYRLYPDKVSLPKTVFQNSNTFVTYRWNNLGWGYCPTNIPQWNQKYKVALALLDPLSSKAVKIYVHEEPCLNEWIKGPPNTYTWKFNLDNVAPGTYNWGLGIVDTTNDNKIGLEIAAKGEYTFEGWLKLSSVNIK